MVGAAEAAKGVKVVAAGPPRRRFAHRRNDIDIFVALKHLEVGGDSLAHADERFKEDRDFILYAIEHDAEALAHVEDKQLLENRDFAFEAVCRNPDALQFLPEAHRADRRVVAAAAARDPEALRLAAPELRSDPELAEAAERGEQTGWYDGEHLMLTGSFSNWMTADSRCRLFKLTSKSVCSGSAEWPANEATVPDPPRAAGAVRHRIVALLPSGCLSFQLVSCAKGGRFRVLPVETYRGVGEPLRLACGRPSAVPAALGGGGDGDDCRKQFYISEAPFVVVSIYVEVLRGAAARQGPEESGCGAAGTNRGIAVWFVFEPLRARYRSAVELFDQDTPVRIARGLAGGQTCLPAIDIVAGVDCCAEDLDPEVRDFYEQMCRLCRRTTQQHWGHIHALSAGLYLAVAVERQEGRVVAFCRYDLMESANHVADERFDPKRSAFMPCAPPCLVIEHIEVLESRRGLGLGRLLVQRLVREARKFRCGAVKLISVSSSRGFYERLGFEAKYQLDNEQTWREIEPKEHPGHEVETREPRAVAAQDDVEADEPEELLSEADDLDEPHMRSWLLENRRLPVAMELRLSARPPWSPG